MAEVNGRALSTGIQIEGPAGNGSEAGEELKVRILEVLRAHPEGFTILELSERLGSHRQTVSKYILVLEALGLIHRRRLGSATLLYLKAAFEERISESLRVESRTTKDRKNWESG
jgi:DNA-binding transcriptional ArsR family regulator